MFINLSVNIICPTGFCLRDGNESGEAARHNLYEYNLYDRNYDRVRGRGYYRNQDRAYPSDQYYQYPKPSGSQRDNSIEWTEG